MINNKKLKYFHWNLDKTLKKIVYFSMFSDKYKKQIIISKLLNTKNIIIIIYILGISLN